MSQISSTARAKSPEGYNLAQLVLHWSIAALVFWQLFVSYSPGAAERMARFGRTPTTATAFLSESHIWVGFAILALVVVRLILRLKRPAPPVEESSRLIASLGKASHNLFYVLLFFMPITGILSYYFGLPTGQIHEAGQPIFVGLIAVHAAAALWHQYIRRDGLLTRMLVPASD